MGEPSSDQEEMNPQQTPKRPKGGLITMPFIIANEAFEKVSSYGLMPNMIIYLMRDYRVTVAKGTNILFFWSAATNFMPLLGAFVSDSYLGRFLTIALGCIASFLGTVLLWSTTMIPHIKPPPCDQSTQGCKSPTAGQMTFLISSFVLISIGAGGIRPCSLAFGADQLQNKVNSGNKRILESFFGWYYASSAVAVLIALTGIVYIQDHLGWKVGFGVPAIIMLFSALSFFLASPLYIKRKAKQSLFTGFVQVVVASYKNRKLSFPPLNSKGGYHQKKDSNLVAPTDKLRFLNKACIISNPELDLALDGSASNPWRLCTIEQVEELKALIKVIPIWTTGAIMSINISQNSFPLLQANSMNRHISSGFQIPAASFGMFTIITLTIWILLYDRAILPLASKIKGKPVMLGVKLRMGLGIFFSFLSMTVSAIVENIRRRRAIREGFANNGQAVLTDMSAMWLVPQHCLNGLAEAFNAIGQTEFYYSEFPRSMSSIASALFGLGMAVANLLASVILSSVDHISSKGGKESWVSNNINRGRYDNYYWVLAILSFINLLYFVVCSWWYGPCAEPYTNIEGDQELTELDKSPA
ncbi:protein NRT1/ PTR FAMILY 1.2-like [Tripterygium wilfordii]|uniref:protein NRT1/ PTR FAMILY 1.2-like n=1 Tax=Tripterygium wilfordii TaxID=458696 RepID=UPI0018F7EAAF|nr:protein NRT1/ PTR FAMILY 1.2-like [Tripterygium wilfordii]